MNFHIGIDVGGFGVRVYARDRGVVMDESSAWAVRGGRRVALGDKAYELLGRTPHNTQVVYPIKGGAIAREDALHDWLTHVIGGSAEAGRTLRPRVIIARAPAMEQTQMKRLTDMALDAGASTCMLMRSDVCAALGAGLDVSKPRAHMMIDVGAGSVDAMMIAMNTVVRSESLPYGVSGVDEEIARMIAARHGLHIGPRTAEAVKVSLAQAVDHAGLSEQVTGLDGASGFPRTIEVEAGHIGEAIRPLLTQIAQLAERMILSAEHDVFEELLDDGIVLTGGGAQVYGLDKLIAERTQVKCRVVDNPGLAVARGLGVMMESAEVYERLTEEKHTIFERRLPGVRR